MTCTHNYDNPIRKGRADYHCRLCDKDITLELVLLYKLTLQEQGE